LEIIKEAEGDSCNIAAETDSGSDKPIITPLVLLFLSLLILLLMLLLLILKECELALVLLDSREGD
jgi:hypothetical protein